MQTTTTIRVGKRTFRVPQLMIKPKEIVDETFDIYRISVSDIGDNDPTSKKMYDDLFNYLKTEDTLLDITFINGTQKVKMLDALVTHYVYPFGIVYEFEAEKIKEGINR